MTASPISKPLDVSGITLARDVPASGWQARLALAFENRGGTTVLSRREHWGPLRIQKPLYPEGAEVCHGILLHPPGGIAGGDVLEMELAVGQGAHALITTPGASKWYRSPGMLATQRVQLAVAPGGILEWFPQEAIVFNGARARMETRVSLAADACFLGWEITCLGRRASGERFEAGVLNLATYIEREGRPLWMERGELEGGGRLLQSPAGWAGFSVSATFHAVHVGMDSACLTACRAVRPQEEGARFGVTRFPEMLVARYLGHSAESARNWCVNLWRHLRPALLKREGVLPRIWST